MAPHTPLHVTKGTRSHCCSRDPTLGVAGAGNQRRRTRLYISRAQTYPWLILAWMSPILSLLFWRNPPSGLTVLSIALTGRHYWTKAFDLLTDRMCGNAGEWTLRGRALESAPVLLQADKASCKRSECAGACACGTGTRL